MPLKDDFVRWGHEDEQLLAAQEEEAKKKKKLTGDDDNSAPIVDLPNPSKLPRTLTTKTPLLPWEVDAEAKTQQAPPPADVQIIPRQPVKKRKMRLAKTPLKRGSSAKPVEEVERERHLPLLRIALSMEYSGIQATPSREEVSGELASLVALFQEAVIGLDCLLLDDEFADFTRPLIAGRASSFPLGDGVNLRAVFENDEALATFTAGIERGISTSYDAVEAYVDVLGPFHSMFQEVRRVCD